jgi:protein-S-isoprenylcysteine O-methyltransferase Ste14
VVFFIALINAVAYLAGAGQVVRWAAIPVTSGSDAAVAIIVGLLVIFAEALLAYWVYRRAKRVWWPRYVRHRARASRY